MDDQAWYACYSKPAGLAVSREKHHIFMDTFEFGRYFYIYIPHSHGFDPCC